jgi:hypothetical protein
MEAAGSSEMPVHFYRTTVPLGYLDIISQKTAVFKDISSHDHERYIRHPQSLQNPKYILHFTHPVSDVLFSEGD